jgi:hypothetical protein
MAGGKVGNHAPSDHESVSSSAQRWRFSIRRESTLGNLTSWSGARDTAAITGVTNTAAASTVTASIRLKKLLSGLLPNLLSGTPAKIFMIVFLDS